MLLHGTPCIFHSCNDLPAQDFETCPSSHAFLHHLRQHALNSAPHVLTRPCCVTQERDTAEPNWENSKSPEPERAWTLAEGYCKVKFAVADDIATSNLLHRRKAHVDQTLRNAKFLALAGANPIEFRFPTIMMVLRRK